MRSAAGIGYIIGLKAIANELDAEFSDRQSLSRRIVGLADNFDLVNIVNLAQGMLSLLRSALRTRHFSSDIANMFLAKESFYLLGHLLK